MFCLYNEVVKQSILSESTAQIQGWFLWIRNGSSGHWSGISAGWSRSLLNAVMVLGSCVGVMLFVWPSLFLGVHASVEWGLEDFLVENWSRSVSMVFCSLKLVGLSVTHLIQVVQWTASVRLMQKVWVQPGKKTAKQFCAIEGRAQFSEKLPSSRLVTNNNGQCLESPLKVWDFPSCCSCATVCSGEKLS